MKNLKALLIATTLFITTQSINAQAAKMAHVDLAEIATKYPAMIDANKQLEKLSQTYQADYKKMVEEYQAKLKGWEADVAKVEEKVNQERQKEAQDMEKRIQEFGQNAQKEIETKTNDLMKPLEEKIKVAIQKVGKAKGFQYVLNGAGLLLADGPNITNDVKKELGITVAAAPTK